MNESVLPRRHKEPISQRPCPPLFKGWARALRAGRGQPKAVYKTCGEAAPQLSGLKGPSNLRTLRTFGARGPVPLWCLRHHLPLASGGTIKVGNPSSQPTASAVPLFYTAAKPPPQPSGPKAPSNLRTLRPRGRSILRTFPSEPFEPFEPSHRRCVQWRSRAPLFFKICGVSRHHHPRPERPSNLRTLRTLGTKSRQPSRRRRVH